MPFAGYDSFGACREDNQDKDDPEAFCAYLHKEATGEYPNQSAAFDDVDAHARAVVAGAVARALDGVRED